MLDRYVEQVRLLLSTLPEIAKETVFALKGGTAINLFYRDMPRLSVDIDLTYLPVGDRQSSLRDIDDALGRIATAIAGRNPQIEARRIAGGGASDTRVMVSDGKLHAALDRQHPRDLFDVKLLYENEGLTDDLFRRCSSSSSAAATNVGR